MALLEIRNLSVRFPTARGLALAADGVDLCVDAGDVLGIVGESGSGKSVSLLAVMGLLGPEALITAERMRFDGRDLLNISESEKRRLLGREIAMIFQDPLRALNPCFTAGWQIAEVLAIHDGGSRRQRRRRATELLEQVGIPEPERRLASYPHQLSGGMAQRVMIAMAIACNPRLLLADEPTTALDVTVQQQILDLLLRLQRERGMALVLVTHDMGVMAQAARRISVMYAGETVEELTADQLFAGPQHPYTASLLRARPDPASPRRRLASIPGVVPGIEDRPPGCLFTPRCFQARPEHCIRRRPSLEGAAGQRVRCHYPLDKVPAQAPLAV